MSQFEDYQAVLSPALAKSTQLIAAAGSGQYLTDVDGRTYVDWVQGIAVNALGHCHPRVVAAIQQQVSTLITASFNVVSYVQTGTLAQRIAAAAPGELGSTFFSNGGAEAIDGALKLARVATHRPGIIAFRGSFHGRSLGATSVTGSNAKYRAWVEPLVGGIHFTTYPSADQCPPGFDEHQRAMHAAAELDRLLSYVVAPDTVAAILMEPIQGEGGYVVPPREFVEYVRKVCDDHGILLIFDEIQSGYGRTGRMFASEHHGVVPDIMTLGKAIAGGLPMSAIVSTPELMSRWKPGMHGGTFGGNPVAAAAGLAVLDVFEEEGVIEHAADMGAYMRARLEEFAATYDFITDVRGLGMMLALQLDHLDGRPGGDLVAALQKAALEAGLLTLSCGVKGNGLRIAAPLTITRAQADEGLDLLATALSAIQHLA